MKRWALQDAKAHLSDVLRDLTDEPQTVTVRNQPAIVIVKAGTRASAGRGSRTFIKFMRSSPLRGLDLKLRRDRDSGRDTPL